MGVFFTQQQQQGRARMREGPNPEKLRPRGVGPRRVGGGGASSRGNSAGYQQILLQLVGVKGVPINCKTMLFDILEGQTLQTWERGVRWSAAQKQQQTKAAASRKKQQRLYKQQKQAQSAAKAAAVASRNRNTSNKKSSNKQQNQEQHKQHKQQPRKSEGQKVWVPKVEGRLPVEFRLCSRLFFFSGHKQNV